jgi:hypothetical protein
MVVPWFTILVTFPFEFTVATAPLCVVTVCVLVLDPAPRPPLLLLGGLFPAFVLLPVFFVPLFGMFPVLFVPFDGFVVVVLLLPVLFDVFFGGVDVFFGGGVLFDDPDELLGGFGGGVCFFCGVFVL